MAIRIRREEEYVALPVSAKHIFAMRGQKNYSVPIDNVRLTSEDFRNNKELPAMLRALTIGITLKCLVIQLSNENSDADNGASSANYVHYCADCKMHERDFQLSKIEDVNFRLRWKNSKFYPVLSSNVCS